MPRIVRTEIDQFFFHYPSGATIVTSESAGKRNAMAAAWHCPISHDPPYYLVSISPKRFTHRLILESGAFVVNFMPEEKGDLVAAVGGCTGREMDKFSVLGIKASSGSQVAVPVLDDALASYECKLIGRHPTGDHDLFMGEIVAVHYEASAYNEAWVIDLERRRPILYMGANYYSTTGTSRFLDRKALVASALAKRQ